MNAVRYLAALALCTGLLFNFGHSSDKKPAAAKTEPSTDLKDHEPLAALIAKADKTVLYEGLPHQIWEKDTLEKEKKEKTEAEENARIADAEYRQRVIEETIQSFIDYGFDEGHSEQLAIDIAEGNIKNVFIKF